MAKQYIFCINSGRAGSHYLCDLFSAAKHSAVYHESKPQMSYGFTQKVNQYPYAKTIIERRIKINAINEIMAKYQPHYSYIETNHMFIKTFFDVVVNAYKDKVGVVILRRPISKVLKSFIELGYFAKNDEALNWMTRPDAVTSAIKCLKPYREMDQYERAIAYLIDIEARSQRFIAQYPGIKIFNANVDLLNGMSDVRRMFDFFELEFSCVPPIGRRVNERKDRKEKFNNPTTIEMCHKRCLKYLEDAKAVGIKIPQTLII